MKDRILDTLAVGAMCALITAISLWAVAARLYRQGTVEMVAAVAEQPAPAVTATLSPTQPAVAVPTAAAVQAPTVAAGEPAPTPVGPDPVSVAASLPIPPVARPLPAPIIRPTTINGIPFESFAVLTDEVKWHIRQIYGVGLSLGNNPRAFSKVGDSTIESPYFMGWFDIAGRYNLGSYDYLQPVIRYYAGSFGHESVAVARGLRAASALSPAWANAAYCYGNESPVACELRLFRPSLLFIRLGSNEGSAETFDRYLRQLVEYCIERGVIPVLGTKADRREGPANTMNAVIKQVAADYAVPLWDFDLLAQTIPGSGIGRDGVHLTSFFSHDFREPEAFQRGYGVHNLSSLVVLDAIWHVLNTDPDWAKRYR